MRYWNCWEKKKPTYTFYCSDKSVSINCLILKPLCLRIVPALNHVLIPITQVVLLQLKRHETCVEITVRAKLFGTGDYHARTTSKHVTIPTRLIHCVKTFNFFGLYRRDSTYKALEQRINSGDTVHPAISFILFERIPYYAEVWSCFLLREAGRCQNERNQTSLFWI